jgi:3-hydroxyisobutyrate dehydrogenase-like beta-hydroxyacid dehydrogenase
VGRVPEDENRAPSTGVVGLGEIGGGIAGNLMKAGVSLAVCDIRPEATEPYRQGARVAASPRDLAAGCAVVFVAVLNDAQVRTVLGGDDGVFAGAAAGTTVVVVSTITTDTVREMREAGAAHGVTVVDCGVSGGTQGAADGQLVCMVGGTEEEVDRIRPVLDVFSRLVLHMGPPGTGLSAKLARNVVQYGSWLAAQEAQELAEAAGVDLLKLGEAIRESDQVIGGAARLILRPTAEPWPESTDAGLLAFLREKAAMAHKDLDAARALGAELGVAMPVAALTDERCDRIFGVPEDD